MIDYDLSDGICVLRLNAPPLGMITLELLDELLAAIRRVSNDGEVCAAIITGDEKHFSAGADINLFRQIESDADAMRTSQSFQEAFGEVEACPKPIAAAVAGRVMGGALELALACHYRVATSQSRFSMPEVRFGFNPGAGGTQRLPRLIGPQKALWMLITAESLGAEEALKLGLVDADCRPGELVDTTRRLLRSVSTPRRTSELCEKVQDAEHNAAAIAEAMRLAEKGRPEIIAPWKIIEAVRAGLNESFQTGLETERRAFGECLDTLAAKNKISLFFATRQMGKAPELAGVMPKAVRRAAVVGMGSMGTGITQALVMAGLPVAVCDQDHAALERGVEKIRRSLAKSVEQGRMSRGVLERTLGLLTATTDRGVLAGADLAIESVFEDVEVKRGVIADLEQYCGPDAVIATNTSTISLDALAEGMQRPERLVGMHFFNPAHRMPLVEVIRREATPAEVVATAMELSRRLKKNPVLVNNREGFLVNRIFVPYLKEAFSLLEDGFDAPSIDAAIVQFGFSMGPLTLIDMAGLDILVDTARLLEKALPRGGRISPIASRLVDEGHLGQKTGSGVYRYEPGDHTPRKSEAAQKIIAEVQKEKRGQPQEIGPTEMTERLVLGMVNEAFYLLEEGVVQRRSDVDAATVLGIGFPDFRGGVLKYALDLGLDTVGRRLDNLRERLGERFSPCRLLREMKGA